MIHDELLHKWINNTLSVEELAEFKERPEYDELVELYQKTDELAAPAFDANAMLKEILATPKKDNAAEMETGLLTKAKAKEKVKVVGFPNWLKLAVAASVLLMLGFWGILSGVFSSSNTNMVKYVNSNQSTKNVDLPDGSSFDLATNSSLEYPEKNWLDERVIHLEGEAAFNVVKGNSFKVLTQFGKVEVLGTVFTVTAANGLLNVHCSEGKVKVSDLSDGLPAVLEANESASIVKEKQLIVRKEKYTAYEDVPLKDLTDALSKQFNVAFKISQTNLEEPRTCKFPNGDIEKAFDICFRNQGIKCEKNEDGVYILSP